jgi:hypothetical protein
MSTTCSSCGARIDERTERAGRKPCPWCGSTARTVRRAGGESLSASDRRQRTAAANAERSAATARHVQCAVALRAQGLSAAVIGVRMASEDERDEPYSERQVRKWLARAKKG